jgi:hypothetical protein
MRWRSIIAALAALVIGLTLFDVTPVDARRGGGFSRGGGGFRGGGLARGGGGFRSTPRMSHRGPAVRHARSSNVAHRQRVSGGKAKGQRKHAGAAKKAQKPSKSGGTKANAKNQVGSGKANIGSAKGQLGGKGTLRNLPVSKAVAGGALAGGAIAAGRVAVPGNLRPKMTLTRPPDVSLRPRLAPFVQRHWRHPFFWVAVAGLGYLTIPELYYDRFYTCVGVDDPDYGCAVDLLSAAALEEEQATTRAHYPIPAGTTYRYSAKVAPNRSPGSCSFEPFVERQWNRSFVWVQIPEVGNVTVPEEYYDRFIDYAGKEPPNYPAACKVLVEAAAADTVATAAPKAE